MVRPSSSQTVRSHARWGRGPCAVAITTIAAVVPSAHVVSQPDSVGLRFHHVHYQVADPSAAMAEAEKILKSARVVVQGLGVGLRSDNEFMLFDRSDDAAIPQRSRNISEVYASSVKRIQEFGLTVDPESWDRVHISGARFDGPFHHLAFAAADFRAAVERVGARGGTRVAGNDESVLFDLGGGLLIEIVRDTSRPDAFWCPMHPDIRSPDIGKCPLCAMDLVPIPPPKIGEYKLDVRLDRGADAVIEGLRFVVREPGTHERVTDFAVVHERRFHLFLISRDLEYFEHVHPDRESDGSFVLNQRLPVGEYMLFADFLPHGGTPQMIQRAIVSGRVGPSTSVPATTSTAMKVIGGMAVGISAGVTVLLNAGEIAAGREAPLTFTVLEDGTGARVTDLEPYLGAPAHLLIVRTDLTDAVHAHPEEQATHGPTVSFHPLIPSAGDYKLWIQFQRRGRVITVPFLLPTAR